jgi:probable rRNA maturation factor
MAVEVQVNDEAGAAGHAAFGHVDLPALVERAARAVLEEAGADAGELSITLLTDAAMAEMNLQWKGKDVPTDVLSFPLHGEGETLVGDVYLGVDRAVAQAAELGEPPARELARLAVHGTLHALGWDHPDTGRETSEMWTRQERIVEGLGIG